MSGSENGGACGVGREEVKRAASPAKRSAHEMEDAPPIERQEEEAVPGSFPKVAEEGDAPTDFDTAMAGMSQDQSVVTTAQGSMTTNTSATSFQSEELPPYSFKEEEDWKVKGGTPAPALDEQVAEVMRLAQEPLQHGDRGTIVSSKWLGRVIARTTEKKASKDFPNEAREGPIGQVDNSDIVSPEAFTEPILKDANGMPFVPLKEGLQLDDDYQVLPEKAWGQIVGWYGLAQGQKQITRYAYNTAADLPSGRENIMYELNPPIFTVRKVPQSVQDGNETMDNDKARSAAISLRLKSERRGRGQMSPEDALRIVSSRQEGYQKFLKRAKEYAGIPLNRKVRVWRQLNPTVIAVDKPDATQAGIASPPQSRPTTPSDRLRNDATKLVVGKEEWDKLEIGKDLEHVDLQDQTNNANYNGKSSTMEIVTLFENQTLILEEQMGGPAGGEFNSDANKKRATLGNGWKTTASKPASTTNSGRTSPAPGIGMMTRGRTRRDGRTRGTVGLSNLGNTCYMNSALQCIRSVEELAIYFLAGEFKKEINASNPLGSGGVMAKKYAEVLSGIYSDNASSSFSPTNFKKTLSNQNPVFSGWGQQDSQEFLSYLIDAIHEDLNRIEKKPYLENPDSDDARVTDPEYIKELGQIYQSNHYARNKSVCMDLFSGFYKNTMECPTCDKISVTFDPYASLTLQLPIENTFNHTFTFVPLNGHPVNHDLDLEKNLTMKDVKKLIASKHAGVDPAKLWMVEVYSHKLYKHFDDRLSLAEANIGNNDYIFVYELSQVPNNIPPPARQGHYSTSIYGKNMDFDMDAHEWAESFTVPIFSRKKGKTAGSMLHPLYITLNRDEAKDYNIVLKKVLHRVAQITSRPILIEAEEHEKAAKQDGDSKAEANSDSDNATDEAARVSDHSVPSEDEYVDVSRSKDETPATAPAKRSADGGNVPVGFMDFDYALSQTLRNQLFVMSFARGNDNMLCTGMTGFEDKSVREMQARVKLPVKRDSSDASSSDEDEDDDTVASSPPDGQEVESDEDEEEAGAIASTEESPLTVNGIANDADADGEDDDDLPDDPLDTRSGPRRGNGKENKFKGSKKARRNEKKKLSKKEKRQARAALHKQTSSHAKQEHDENPYYIKLGECIVLDWYPEAIDSLFNGSPSDEDDLRGRYLSNDNGQHLPIVADPATEEKRNRRALRKKNGITLEDCFAETGKREKLSEDNAWFCNRCKEFRQATKTLEIWTCPDIVVVHLKRFGGTRSFRDKIDVMVDYPVEGLDLTGKIGQREDGKEYIYDLFAIDNHFGGLGGGHYTAYAKNFFDGQWYDYNDSSCSKFGDSPRRSAAAYLLFYRRRSDKPLGPEYLRKIVEDFHNPPNPEQRQQQQGQGSADEAYESDAGEGRLGDPSSILRGSSSNSVGAGVGGRTLGAGSLSSSNGTRGLRQGGDVGAGGADRSQRLAVMNPDRSEDDEGIGMDDESDSGGVVEKRMFGPVRPPHLLPQYGNNTGGGWGFDNLNDGNADQNEDADMLLDNADVASNTADLDDDDRALDFDHDGFGELQSSAPASSPAAGQDDWNEHNRSFQMGYENDYEDNHALYSDAHGDGMLHLENAGSMGGQDHEPDAVDIMLDEDVQAKMD